MGSTIAENPGRPPEDANRYAIEHWQDYVEDGFEWLIDYLQRKQADKNRKTNDR